MGQKVSPVALRLGINRTWDSRWFAEKNEYPKLLMEDRKIRALVNSLKSTAAISKIVIERPHKKCNVTIYSARPGILEVKKPEIDATLVAESIAQQLERRVAFRRAMKRAVQTALRMGAGGIRINCGGRLGGAEIARTEWYREGRVPLHTLRANVDYGVATAQTTYGAIGIKVWIFKGEILEHDPMAQEKSITGSQDQSRNQRPE